MRPARRRITVVAPSVVAPDAPTLTAPASLEVVAVGQAVTVSATVTAGQVPDRIDFVLDPGVGEVVVATDAASPYSQTWTVAEDIGEHTLVARFVYGSGSVDSAATTVHIIPAVVWRLRADLGVTKDGSDRVSQWDDQSPTAKNAVQADGAKQPLWVAAGLNGKPIVRFTSPYVMTHTVQRGDGTTVAFMAKTSLTTAFRTLVTLNASAPGIGPIYMCRSGADDDWGLEMSAYVESSYAGSTMVPRVAIVTDVDTVTLRSDGTAEALTNGTTYNFSGGFLGAGTGAGTVQNLEGDIGEIIVFPSVLSAAQALVVEAGLNAFWGT